MIFNRICLALLLLVLPTTARAFTLTHPSIRAGWDTTELTFVVNEASCTALGISAAILNDTIDEAINIWNSAPTSNLKLKRGGTTSSTGASNPPSIWCTNSITDPDSTAGLGGIGSITSAGRPASGGLQLNGDSSRAAYFGGMSVAQRQVVVAHEMGHVLGLGHSEVDYALMYYSVSVKDDANLSQDDVDAITWLNPRKEPQDKVFGCGSIETPSPPTGGGGNAIYFSALLFLMWAGVRLLSGSRKRA